MDANEGLTERRGLAVAGMSASSLRYEPRPDRNAALRARIVALAQRHRRYGVGMIHLKLRQAGELVNHKRVERLYRLEKLHIRRRRRKKIPVSDRQPLIRPGRSQRGLVDGLRVRSGGLGPDDQVPGDRGRRDARGRGDRRRSTRIGGDHLTRILDGICAQRGNAGGDPHRQRAGVHRQGDADLGASQRRIALRLIEPGKPNQNAYVESFNGRFRDECLNEHWFTSLAHARAVIEAWRREYNEERPKKSLGGLTPAQYAKQTGRKARYNAGRL